MKFTLTIKCDNKAFSEEGASHEVSRILSEVAGKIAFYGVLHDGVFVALRDLNGNRIGSWETSA